MNVIHTTANGHVTVCIDSRGTSQFSYTSPDGGWSISGLDAKQCTDLSAALLAEANRQRREAAARFEKCEGCNGHGLVGNILDTDTCPFCHGSGTERRALTRGGMSESGYEFSELVGVEVLPQ